MKYRSDNKTIEDAFNKTWYITGCFFIVTFGLMIYGLFLASKYKLDWLFPTSIIGSIAIGGTLTVILCNYWFKYWLQKVDNPNELFRRATRLNIISPKTALKIAKKHDIDISDNHQSSQYIKLPDIVINKKVSLTNDSITIDNQTFYWKEIDNFKLEPYYTGNRTFLGPTLDLILHFKTDISMRFPLRVIKPNPFNFEYHLDKYFENSKKYNT